jgi:DNA gyrase subunit A
MFFTSRGRVFKLKVYEIPETSRTAKGQAIVNFLQLAPGEKITATMNSNDLESAKFIMMATTGGTIKKTPVKDFENVRRSGLIAIKLKGGDSLEWVHTTTGKDDVILVTSNAMSICFNEKDVRSMGRVASGVRGIKMKGEDRVVGMGVVNKDEDKTKVMLMVVTENGYGKRTPLKEYKTQKRGGSGIRTGKVTEKTGKLATGRIVQKDDSRDFLVISQGGQVIRTSVKSVSSLGRATQGVRVMRFKKADDSVASVAFVEDASEEIAEVVAEIAAADKSKGKSSAKGGKKKK